MAYHLLRSAWRRIPLDIRTRQRIQRRLFRLAPWLFRHHPAFETWRLTQDERTGYCLEPVEGIDCAEYPVPVLNAAPLASPPVRLVAFYLPQFHPIPENDAWWGKGFTDWVNVVRGKPRFPEHYQPHLPGELGFYDLRDSAAQHRQVELAKLYGVGGFAFYFYWFGGRRLLETPILQFLEDDTLDLPFCLCWANENWSRRWDGRDHDLLIEQKHSPDDDLAFIDYVSKYLRDRRYIRISGRPLLIVYRPDLLPAPGDTVRRWRDWSRQHGFGDLYIAYTQSFESRDPRDYGMDAAIEFPPNNANPPVITDQIEALDPEFQGIVFDWTVFPRRSRSYQPAGYRLFRGVNPSWDNEARRCGTGAVFVGSSPRGYQEWLENAIRDTVSNTSEPGERFVFVNAWNEWAEGAHLEPDQRYGYAYLQATRNALQAARVQMQREILVVSHDAQPNGAQYLALNIARELKEHLGYRVHMVVLGGGPLLEQYRRIAPVDVLEAAHADRKRAKKLAETLRQSGISDAIVNTTVSGLFVRPLCEAGIRVIALIHELPNLIRDQRLQRYAQTIAECADRLVFPSDSVRDGFRQFADVDEDKAVLRAQGLYKRSLMRARSERPTARRRLRERLGIASEAEIVVGVGYADLRKGIDLFVEVGIEACRARKHVVFVWVGNLDASLEQNALERIAAEGLLSRFVFTGHEPETDIFFAGADMYAMTSREDPFPSVVLEALQVGVPVVGFEGGGGFTSLASKGCVKLVPSFDTSAFARVLSEALGDATWRQEAGEMGRSYVDREFGFRRYVFDLLTETIEPPPTVSVLIPAYSYRRNLRKHVESILSQTIPVYEIIVLDDGSTSGSREWLESELYALFPEAQVVRTDANAVSVVHHWLTGVQLARGDYVWIAEADDLAEPTFLQTALSGLSDPELSLRHTHLTQIDEDGPVDAEQYSSYVADNSHEARLRQDVSSSEQKIREALADKDRIPNVNGVLSRREPLRMALRALIDDRELDLRGCTGIRT